MMQSRRKRLRAATVMTLALAVFLAGCAPFWQQQHPTSVTQTARSQCPSWTASPAPINLTAPTQPDQRAIALYNAQLVLQTPRPIRNLYDVTQRLVHHSPQPISCVVRTTPRNDAVGHEETFYVVNASQTGYHQVRARLVYKTAHVYMYVQDSVVNAIDSASVRQAADTFESGAYATDRRYFGNQWPTGPDDDPHITVLNTPDISYGGYFSSEDEFPKAVDPYSNERQMIYINVSAGNQPGTVFYAATLAHEFQHMIHWYWHPGDDSWTNEGMSVLAQHVNNFPTDPYDATFLQQPNTMLGGWTDDENADIAHYGAGYLFMDYFAEHYGGYAVLRELLTDPAQTPLNFDHVLARHGSSDRFDDVFAKFVMANLLNNPAAGSAYAYPSVPGDHATPQRIVSAYPYGDGSAGQPATVSQYAAQYYDFRPTTGGSTLNLSFRGSPYNGIVANQPFNGASAEWWSNTADNLDSTLSRSFDLSSLAGSQATLTFAAWYNLEPDFDYAYVEVSTDGHNWTALPATTSTSTNPNGSNYGHGITGISGGGSTPAWIQESVDLSAYAGKRIQVRFETITDDAVHYPGLTVDDIHIPQLGFADDVSTANGWQAEGWLRSDNMLPQTFVLQAAVYTLGNPVPQVRQIPVDAATGDGSIQFSGFGGSVTRVILAVAAMAPSTIVPATYTLSASLS